MYIQEIEKYFILVYVQEAKSVLGLKASIQPSLLPTFLSFLAVNYSYETREIL